MTSPASQFWDDIFSQDRAYSRVEFPDDNDPVLTRALLHFGDVNDKTLIDIGCGRGATSLYFARRGANVISVDLSEIAITNLRLYCQEHGINNITPVHAAAQDISKLARADFIFGSMILHHIEPFSQFARTLRQTLDPNGRAFFWENNARSKMMIWFRQNIVGKLWVPKYGDDEEFPLTVREVDELRKCFNVSIENPELLMFRLVSEYLLRGHLMWPFRMLDAAFYHLPMIRKFSYRQYVILSPAESVDSSPQ